MRRVPLSHERGNPLSNDWCPSLSRDTPLSRPLSQESGAPLSLGIPLSLSWERVTALLGERHKEGYHSLKKVVCLSRGRHPSLKTPLSREQCPFLSKDTPLSVLTEIFFNCAEIERKITLSFLEWESTVCLSHTHT